MHASTPRFTEDLPQIAGETFELAVRLCGPCRDYHAVRPYLRLVGLAQGMERHGSAMAHLVRDLTDSRARILIVGAADAGLLAFTARAVGTRHAGITILDRCPTPLAMCRRFAERWSIDLETRAQDLAEVDEPGRFGLAIGHRVLNFIAADAAVGVLERLRQALHPAGRLLLVVSARDPRAGDPDPAAVSRVVAFVTGELERRRVALPEVPGRFRDRVEACTRDQRHRIALPEGVQETVAHLRAAGFVVESCREIGGRQQPATGVNVTDYVVIGIPAGGR